MTITLETVIFELIKETFGDLQLICYNAIHETKICTGSTGNR